MGNPKQKCAKATEQLKTRCRLFYDMLED